MEHEQTTSKIKDLLSFLNADITVTEEPHDVIRVLVVSDTFKGVHLTKRIDMVSEALLDLAMNYLDEYQLIINPLTFNEVNLKISETVASETHDEIIKLLTGHFEGDMLKVEKWLNSKNGHFGGSAPSLLMRKNRGDKVLLFIKACLEEN